MSAQSSGGCHHWRRFVSNSKSEGALCLSERSAYADNVFLVVALIHYSGIGRECAILFASEGANVVLADINLEACQKTADIVNERFNNAELPVKAIAMKCDVSKEDEVAAIVQKAVDEFGRLDVMFNNAGIMHPADDNALNTEEKIWDLTQAINVKGVWYGCKHAILAMRKNPTDESKNLHVGGSIINTASFVAIMGAATPQIAYTASKGAVLAMTRELAMVHAREGIRVNSLCPYVSRYFKLDSNPTSEDIR